MNIYDKAHEFAKCLEECEEVLEFKKACAKIQENHEDKKMLSDLREIQLKAYSEQMQNGKISDDTRQKLENLGSIITLNTSINEYLQAEYKFGLLWEDIMKIFQDAIGIDANFLKNN